MRIAPNLTALEGKILSFHKSESGPGGEIEFRVIRNLSQTEPEDFIGAVEGEVLKIFVRTSPAKTKSEAIYRAEVIVNADERGERMIARSLTETKVREL